MHPAIEPIEIAQEAHPACSSLRRRVEDTDLDVRMRVEDREVHVSLLGHVHVVDQDAHANTAIGSAYETLGENSARRVGRPDVVLRVERLLCQVRHRQSRHERVATVPDEQEAGLARVRAHRGLEERADAGGGGMLERARRHARVLPVDARAAAREQRCAREHESDESVALRPEKHQGSGISLRRIGDSDVALTRRLIVFIPHRRA